MVKANCIFTIETTGVVKPYGIMVAPKGPHPHPQTVEINANTGKGQKTLESGDYFVYWQFWATIGSTIKITITDDKGKPLRPPISDTLDSGTAKLNENEFTVP